MKIIIAAGVILLCAAYSYSNTNTNQNSIGRMIGVRGGYSSVFGYYGSEIYGMGYYGLTGVPYSSGIFFTAVDLSFTPYALTESRKSALTVTSLGFRPSLQYNIYPLLTAYGGFAVNANFVYLNAINVEKKVYSFKPGFSFEGGLLVPYKSVNPFAGVNYSFVIISNKALHSTGFFIGVAYNFDTYSLERKQYYSSIAVSRSADYVKSGKSKLSAKNIITAENDFKEALNIDSDNLEAKKYLNNIESIKSHYVKGKRHYDNKNFYDAAYELRQCADYFPEADKMLAEIDNIIKSEIITLEKKGIESYEKHEYGETIKIMRQIKKADPDNETVKLYLPRAENRKNALEKLK